VWDFLGGVYTPDGLLFLYTYHGNPIITGVGGYIGSSLFRYLNVAKYGERDGCSTVYDGLISLYLYVSLTLYLYVEKEKGESNTLWRGTWCYLVALLLPVMDKEWWHYRGRAGLIHSFTPVTKNV
jgi:hypothetical protein